MLNRVGAGRHLLLGRAVVVTPVLGALGVVGAGDQGLSTRPQRGAYMSASARTRCHAISDMPHMYGSARTIIEQFRENVTQTLASEGPGDRRRRRAIYSDVHRIVA
jgi:hypothetical protein